MTPRPGLPYAHLNLRTNPFRTLSPEERAALAVVDLEPWAGRIRSRLSRRSPASPAPRDPSPGVSRGHRPFGRRPSRLPTLVLQLLGPPGCGKTTHLAVLRAHVPGAPRVAWSAPGGEGREASGGEGGRDGWPSVPEGDPLFLDDAHELAGEAWPAILTGRRVVVAATQRDLGPVLAGSHAATARCGPAGAGPVEVRTIRIAERIAPDHLDRIVARRLEWARRGPGPLPKVARATLVSLLARHGPDLRAVTDDLYERIQTHGPLGTSAQVMP